MLSKASYLFCLLVLMVNRSSGQRRGYYTVVAPGSVRTNTPYHVSVSLSDFNTDDVSVPVSFKISLTAEGQLNKQQTVEVQPGTTELITFQVPKLQSGIAKLNVEGRGIISNKTVEVDIQDFDYQTYIHTDKPKYKPGELVRFRVICIDELTRPAVTEDVLSVLIYDGDQNLVKKIDGIALTQGVYKGQLQLADHPVLGNWRIIVESNGSKRREKSIQVSRYVLPMFKVEIATKSDVSVHEDDIEISIMAIYAHDEPVNGSLKIIIKEKDSLECPIIRFSRQMPIDGRQHISVNFQEDFRIRKRDWKEISMRLCSLDVGVRVTDFITKQVVEERAVIAVHSSPYKIKVSPSSLSDEIVEVKVSVTDLQNNPIKDIGNPVTILVENSNEDVPMMKRETIYLNETAVGVAHLNLMGFSKYSVSAEFNNYTTWEGQSQTDTGLGLNLDIHTPSLSVGEHLVAQVRSNDPLDYFVYEIVSRGTIVHSERINVPENATTYLLRINTTHAMIPKIALYVHRIKEGVFDSSLKFVSIGKAFKNSVKIETEKEVKPGASVSVNVTTDEGSYVGLKGIDRRLMSGSESAKDLTEDLIFSIEYDAININKNPGPGAKAGLITLTNLFQEEVTIVTRINTDNIQGWGKEEPGRVRSIFSDGWLFDDFERTPRGGLQLHSRIPDAITSWEIVGFALNPSTGLGLTKDFTTLKVFQSFFISMDLPTLIREGEILEIPVFVFNYNNEDVQTNVTIESQSEHLVVLESFRENAAFSFKQTISMSLPAQGRVSLTFSVKPLKAGHFNLTVKATSPLVSDVVLKTLNVVSAGVPELASTIYIVPFLQDTNQTDEIPVNIPENAVRGSESIELSVVGDTFGPLMEGVRSLVQVPEGNGMEITTHFISNVLVLKYLKAFNQTNPSLERKALLFLETGYQNLLTLKHLDGSFSFFNRFEKTTGNPLETAIVLWGLKQAESFIPAVRNVAERSLNYLKQKHHEAGRFRTGTALDDDALLTSFVLLALIEENPNSSLSENVISKGLTFLYNILDDLRSETSIAISKYVLVLGRHEKFREILSQLSSQSNRIHTSQSLFWTKPNTLQGNLEATSQSFLSLLQSQANPTETLIPLVSALLSTGNSEKIPTHLMALDTMIEVARDLRFGARNLNISFTSDRGDSGDLRVNSSNVHVIQDVQLNSATRKVHLRTVGKGFAVIHIKSKCNIPRENSPSSIYQTNVTITKQVGRFVSLEVCVSVRPVNEAAHLIAVELNLPSGYTLVEKESDNRWNFAIGLDSQANWASPRLRVGAVDGSVRAIFKDIDHVGDCIDVPAMRSFRVLNAKVVSVGVYNVYNESQKTITFHELDLPKEIS